MSTELITQNTDIITLITLIAILIAILTIHQNQSKRFDALNDKFDAKFDALKDEVYSLKDRMSGVESEIKILSKLFGRFETENKNLMDKVLDVLTPKTTVL